jgi:hypothetical protein
VKLTTHLHLMLRLRIHGAVTVIFFSFLFTFHSLVTQWQLARTVTICPINTRISNIMRNSFGTMRHEPPELISRCISLHNSHKLWKINVYISDVFYFSLGSGMPHLVFRVKMRQSTFLILIFYCTMYIYFSLPYLQVSDFRLCLALSHN